MFNLFWHLDLKIPVYMMPFHVILPSKTMLTMCGLCRHRPLKLPIPAVLNNHASVTHLNGGLPNLATSLEDTVRSVALLKH